MTWTTRIIVLLSLVMVGCATTGRRVPPTMTLVRYASMQGIHCARISTSGIYQIIFDKDETGGPVTRYLLDAVRKHGATHYKVRVYASTHNEKPDVGIYYRQFPGKVALMIEIRAFESHRDTLVIVDDQGEHPLAVQ